MTRPPAPERRDHVHREHGLERPDPWAWMRDRDDPVAITHLKAENAHTEAVTAHLEGLRKRLFDELLGRIQEDDESVPVADGGWQYLTRTVSGKAYPIHLRRRDGSDGVEQVLLDENLVAEGKSYCDVGLASVSADHRLLAWAVDETGGELYTLRFRDLETGEDLPDTIEDIWPDVAWSTDHRTVWYTRVDEALRPHQVVRHTLGTDPADDVVVYQEDDERFRVGVGRTRNDAWLLLACASSTTTEIRYVPADRPAAVPVVFSPRHTGCEYHVDAQEDRWLILTNDSDDADGRHDDRAATFALKCAPLGATRREDWFTWIAARPEVTLVDVDAFHGFVVLSEREGGATWLRVLADDGSVDRRVPMPEAAFVAGGGENPSFHATAYRYVYTSLTTPMSTWEVDLVSGVTTLLKEQPVRGGYDRARYVSERRHAIAPDGTAVPISLVRHVDTPIDGDTPTLLYGYGAYGITIDPAFSLTRLSLLDRGVIFAIAHVRGGGFLGRPWKDAGKLGRKQNTFTDFIAAARSLCDAGVTSPDRLAIMGGSAGGLLVGAVLNQAPGLCRSAVAEVPFVDVVSTMLDATLPLTANEWEEWGDPRAREAFDTMLAYSPYDNVRLGPYPDVLVTSGLNDPRVAWWEPTKWVARLRERSTNDPQILLKMELDTGHGGKTGRYGWLEETAFVYAWLLDRWGLTEAAP